MKVWEKLIKSLRNSFFSFKSSHYLRWETEKIEQKLRKRLNNRQEIFLNKVNNLKKNTLKRLIF